MTTEFWYRLTIYSRIDIGIVGIEGAFEREGGSIGDRLEGEGGAV